MRPRIFLLLFGFITAVLSILALAKNSLPPSIMGAAITEKISNVPSSPSLYFSLFLVLGVVAVIVALVERKVVY